MVRYTYEMTYQQKDSSSRSSLDTVEHGLCRYYVNTKREAYRGFRNNGSLQLFDVEDLVKYGKDRRGNTKVK
jgi:hypothetical protein